MEVVVELSKEAVHNEASSIEVSDGNLIILVNQLFFFYIEEFTSLMMK